LAPAADAAAAGSPSVRAAAALVPTDSRSAQEAAASAVLAAWEALEVPDSRESPVPAAQDVGPVPAEAGLDSAAAP